MKRITALIFTCLLLVSLTLCGCSENKSDYIINNDNTICIGVLTSTPTDGTDADAISGIAYATQLAHTVNLDKPYEISIKTIKASTEEDIQSAVSDFISENVAAVICEGRDKSTTDTIIESFAEFSSIPLVFMDCYSNSIAETNNAFSISVPYSYQASAVVSHLIGEGKTTGAVVLSADDQYNKDFAKIFESTFTASGGNSVTTYYYAGEEKNFNANTISAAEYDFVFVIGNPDDSKQIHSELVSADVSSSVIFSEISDKNTIESTEFNGVTFISKFESDDNNYIGTDFINTYADANNISTSDVTASIAYGYDAYMTIYDSLVSMNGNQNSIFNTTEATKSKAESDNIIYASDVTNAIKSITHMGVTDVIEFSDNGLTTPSFVYTDRIENAHAGMLNRYNYTNEQN